MGLWKSGSRSRGSYAITIQSTVKRDKSVLPVWIDIISQIVLIKSENVNHSSMNDWAKQSSKMSATLQIQLDPEQLWKQVNVVRKKERSSTDWEKEISDLTAVETIGLLDMVAIETWGVFLSLSLSILLSSHALGCLLSWIKMS